MGLTIDDGTGQGGSAKVNSGNRLYTNSISKTVDAQINIDSGNVWSIPFENLSPTGANDYVIYIKNTGEETIQFSDLMVSAETSATQLSVHHVSGTASGGNDITTVSRTLGSPAVPTAIVKSGVDITGLTSESILFYIQCDTVGRAVHFSTSSKVRVPKGQAIAIQVETATASLTGVISMVQEIDA